jgi:hypothetical protein
MNLDTVFKFRAYIRTKYHTGMGALKVGMYPVDSIHFKTKKMMIKGRSYKISTKNVLMQYTGLKDINGKEIYENDIIKGWGLVIYSDWHCQYVVSNSKCPVDFEDLTSRWNEKIEVIGNIFENEGLMDEIDHELFNQ